MSHALKQSTPPAAQALNIDELFAQHIAANFSGDRLEELQKQFQEEHVVPLRQLCPPALFGPLRDEAFDIMERFGVQRDFVLEITDNTPRHMTTVGQPIIKDHGPLIHFTYFSPVLKDFVSKVVGEELF